MINEKEKKKSNIINGRKRCGLTEADSDSKADSKAEQYVSNFSIALNFPS